MPTGNTIFKELEPNDHLPEYLKHAIVAEVDTIRNTMNIVTHFTEHLLTAITICLPFTEEEETR
jgi:hypothetical protein